MTAFAVCFLSSCSENDAIKDDLVGTWNLKQGDAVDIIWESSEGISVDDIKLPTSAAAAIATEYSSVQLREKMRSLTFKDNNDLEATYLDDMGNWKTDVIGTFKVVSRTKMLFYPNINKLFGEIGGMDVANIDSEIKTLATVAGLPVHITFSGQTASSIRLFLDTNTLKEANLIPLLFRLIAGEGVDPTIYNVIEKELPRLLKQTDKIEMGFGFDKTSS